MNIFGANSMKFPSELNVNILICWKGRYDNQNKPAVSRIDV